MVLSNNPKLVIELDNGLYCLGDDSATGKTYIHSIVRTIMSVKNVLAYTYSDTFINDWKSILSEHKYDFVLLDRGDMYLTADDLPFLKEYSKDSIVLVAARRIGVCIDDWRIISLSEEGIRVW